VQEPEILDGTIHEDSSQSRMNGKTGLRTLLCIGWVLLVLHLGYAEEPVVTGLRAAMERREEKARHYDAMMKTHGEAYMTKVLDRVREALKDCREADELPMDETFALSIDAQGIVRLVEALRKDTIISGYGDVAPLRKAIIERIQGTKFPPPPATNVAGVVRLAIKIKVAPRRTLDPFD
jgi:hypothetical protein